MKERPIIFSTAMVQAILEGRKIMTRRIVKLSEFGDSDTRGYKYHFRDKKGRWNDVTDESLIKFCPYGNPGDHLWVKETFAKVKSKGTYLYKSDKMFDNCGPSEIEWKWTPSIYMPRLASRITLEITDVRVERLQDITEQDAIKEGVFRKKQEDGTYWHGNYGHPDGVGPLLNAIESFRSLWLSINGEDSWNQNPWVWVISFEGLQSQGRRVK